MGRLIPAILLTAAIIGPVAPLVAATADGAPTRKVLPAFGSEDELVSYLRKAQDQARYTSQGSQGSELEEVVTTAARAEPSITNSQYAGVDEGGIVKRHGDHLVILRRGRLFTVDLSQSRLRPVASINAYAPDEDPGNTWYDEMLVSGDTVAVIGYSYERGGTELGLFDINAKGLLRYRATYHLRSHDYYSSRNYASRLIGSKLILYAPLNLAVPEDEPLEVLPAIRKWHANATPSEFRRIIAANRVFIGPSAQTPTSNLVLHSVTVCDLAQTDLSCHASGVVGDWGEVFYVSPKAVYVWAGNRAEATSTSRSSTLVRMPLDGADPQAIGVVGDPVDQFSFDETDSGMLNVLVRSESGGDAMWNAEHTDGAVALLRLPIRSFGDGADAAPLSDYQILPTPTTDASFHNRFIGDYVLYGTGARWDSEQQAPDPHLFVANTKTRVVTRLMLAHGVDRLESTGGAALVVGEAGENLHFTGVSLRGVDRPAVTQHVVLRHLVQGETRSQGFFYQPDDRQSDEGVIALPVRRPAAPIYASLFDESAAVVFIRRRPSRFNEIGRLVANDSNRVVPAAWRPQDHPGDTEIGTPGFHGAV